MNPARRALLPAPGDWFSQAISSMLSRLKRKLPVSVAPAQSTFTEATIRPDHHPTTMRSSV